MEYCWAIANYCTDFGLIHGIGGGGLRWLFKVARPLLCDALWYVRLWEAACGVHVILHRILGVGGAYLAFAFLLSLSLSSVFVGLRSVRKTYCRS